MRHLFYHTKTAVLFFVAKHPVTKPRLDVIKRSERNLDDCIDELMKTAIETTEEIKINAH
mgnify:CR=1 FL=1